MIYDYINNTYRLNLEDIYLSSIQLSPLFVENTKLKDFVDEKSFIIREQLLSNVLYNENGYGNTLHGVADALKTLDTIYSNVNPTKLEKYLTKAVHGASHPISRLAADFQINAVIQKLYLLFLLTDFLDVDERILLQSEEWKHYVIKLYETLPKLKEKIPINHFTSLNRLNKILLRLERHMYYINISLGNLLLQHRQQYNIQPTRNIITKGPNDSTGINLHNVMYFLRTDN